MPIQLTSTASERVRHYLEQEGAAALRVGIRRTGCSGYAYTIDLENDIGADDRVFEQDGLTIVVDRDSMDLVDGSEIDFVSDGLNRNFRFRNPNVTGECGCGESFTVS